MSALVNDHRPGAGAIASQPQAAIVSVMARPAMGAALAAKQQSSSSKTSEVAFSNTV